MILLRAVLTALKLAARDTASRGRSPGEALERDRLDIELPGLMERENFDSTDYDVRSLAGPIDPVTHPRAAHRQR